MIYVKRCYVDENLHIIKDYDDFDKAVAIANLISKDIVELAFFKPVATSKDLDESYASVEEWGEKNGYASVTLPSLDTCFIANVFCKQAPEFHDCHLGAMEIASPKSRDWYVRLNSCGKIAYADVTEKLDNVYASVLMPLKEFKSLNPSNAFPVGYVVSFISGN